MPLVRTADQGTKRSWQDLLLHNLGPHRFAHIPDSPKVQEGGSRKKGSTEPTDTVFSTLYTLSTRAIFMRNLGRIVTGCGGCVNLSCQAMSSAVFHRTSPWRPFCNVQMQISSYNALKLWSP
eukprot:5519399-Amphidinium_carterae.1